MGNVLFADELVDELEEIFASEEAPEEDEDLDDDEDDEGEDDEGIEPEDMPHG
jgi:hypothetical protein